MLKIQNTRSSYDSKALLLVDENLIVIFINQRAIDLLNVEEKKIIGNNLLIYLTSETRKQILPILEIILSNNYGNNKNQSISKFSSEIEDTSLLEIILTPIFSHNCDTIKKIKISLRQLNSNRKKILTTPEQINNLSHEIRSPLFNIRSFLETLYEYNDHLTNRQRLEFLEIATNETNRLNYLVKNILDFAELENQNEYEVSQLLIDDILNEIIQLNQLTAINKKLLLVKAENNQCDNLILAHYSSLMRVLSNLLNNAIKFTYPNGIINIYTRNLQSNFLDSKSKKSVLRVSVIDTGIGISKQHSRNVFTRFSRGNKKSHLITGSGLGLAIVKEALAKNNQELSLSSNVRKGSSISFSLQKRE